MAPCRRLEQQDSSAEQNQKIKVFMPIQCFAEYFPGPVLPQHYSLSAVCNATHCGDTAVGSSWPLPEWPWWPLGDQRVAIHSPDHRLWVRHTVCSGIAPAEPALARRNPNIPHCWRNKQKEMQALLPPLEAFSKLSHTVNNCQTHTKALLRLGTQSKMGSCLRVPAPLSVVTMAL